MEGETSDIEDKMFFELNVDSFVVRTTTVWRMTL